jgi:hypothetical protein
MYSLIYITSSTDLFVYNYPKAKKSRNPSLWNQENNLSEGIQLRVRGSNSG